MNIPKENGNYKIIKSVILTDNQAFVIAKNMYTGDYVTWEFANDETSFFWGHYFDSEHLYATYADFYARISRAALWLKEDYEYKT